VYAAAGDVDPRVGEHVLDALALQGIAAYLQPAADLHPVTRNTTLPSRPTDRLFVDREHLGTARDYLAHLAEDAAPNQDIDELFAGIVAGFETRAESVTWPAAESLDEDEPDDPPAVGLKRWRRSTVEPKLAANDPFWATTSDPFPPGADEEDDEDEDEGYVPPPPPPLPRISLVTVLSLVSVVAGFVVFFKPDLLPVSGGLAMVAGFVAVLAGFVGLILRLRSGDDDDDWDPDNGAVV
jgi:hypothetical protein